jgi:hypothetical protein
MAPIEPFAIPATCTTPVLSVRAQWLPVDKVSIVQAGSNHDSHSNPLPRSGRYDTPTAPFSRQVWPTLVSVRHSAGTSRPATHSKGRQDTGGSSLWKGVQPLVLTRNHPVSHETIRCR